MPSKILYFHFIFPQFKIEKTGSEISTTLARHRTHFTVETELKMKPANCWWCLTLVTASANLQSGPES